MKRTTGMIMVLCFLLCTIIFTETKARAAKLSAQETKIQTGSKLKINLYFYYGNKKPKWSLSNKKAKIVSKGKSWCKIKAKRKGTIYVKCKIGKRTYKKKITIKAKSKVTYGNYSQIEQGDSLPEVEELIGRYSSIYSSYSHTEAEYQQYYQWYLEDGPGSIWEDSLYHEQVEYKWTNPWTRHSIYCTFNDGVLVRKQYL